MKILNQLTIKHLKMNKKRTIVTIIGIVLSTALMVGIGLLFSTIQDNSIRTLKKDLGDYHALYSNIAHEKLDIFSNNHHVEEYFYDAPIGFSKLASSKNDFRKYIFVNSVSKNYFTQMELIKGRFPTTSNEIVISNQIEIDMGENYQIGDTITLSLGTRIIEGEETLENIAYYGDDMETFHVKEEKQYTIVGIMEQPVFEEWGAAGYTFLTAYDGAINNVNVYVKFIKPSRAYKDGEMLAKNLGLPIDSETEENYVITYNNSLLALYGASKYNNIMSAIINVLMIILTLISIGCIIVIYNSFAISVMERKKQFGLFSSIGATKKQLRHTVFFEAFIVGLIGIPLGVLSSFIGIGIVIAVINYLLPELFRTNLVLTAYPAFLMIPILFMIITVLVSAYIPAYKASKITPIEAIRLNDDIKIKNKKLKTRRWIRNLFGIEGEIALKNIKRNKRKYRITIVSLFISIVLFVSFSTFVEYGLKTSEDALHIPSYDISLSLNDPSNHDYSQFIRTLRNYEGVEKSIIVKSGAKYSTSYGGKEIYASNVINDYGSYEENYVNLVLLSLEQSDYETYLKELGLKEERPILLNKIQYTIYQNSSRKVYNSALLKDSKKSYSFDLCEVKESSDYGDTLQKDDFDCTMTLDNIFVTDKIPFAIEDNFLRTSQIVIIIPETLFNQLYQVDTSGYQDDITLFLKVPKYKKIDAYITEYIDGLTNKKMVQYFNYPKDMKQVNNLYLVIGILLYGFITLVTLIGVTSVFNTIHTSIALRRKEFAMLRSMGLTPHGFNKILYFESFFFGAKSLLYGIPFSFLVILWIHVVMINVSSPEQIMIPWKSIGIAILGVFIIVFVTMMYATKKMKKENILDAIREENI